MFQSRARIQTARRLPSRRGARPNLSKSTSLPEDMSTGSPVLPTNHPTEAPSASMMMSVDSSGLFDAKNQPSDSEGHAEDRLPSGDSSEISVISEKLRAQSSKPDKTEVDIVQNSSMSAAQVPVSSIKSVNDSRTSLETTVNSIVTALPSKVIPATNKGKEIFSKHSSTADDIFGDSEGDIFEKTVSHKIDAGNLYGSHTAQNKTKQIPSKPAKPAPSKNKTHSVVTDIFGEDNDDIFASPLDSKKVMKNVEHGKKRVTKEEVVDTKKLTQVEVRSTESLFVCNLKE